MFITATFNYSLCWTNDGITILFIFLCVFDISYEGCSESFRICNVVEKVNSTKHYIPVFIASELSSVHCGTISPTNTAMPMIERFLVEDRSTTLRLDRFTPTNTPIVVMMTPPRTGKGMLTNIAATLARTPRMIKIRACAIKTCLLATWRQKKSNTQT